MDNLRHVGIVVSDLDKAINVYTDYFGFELKAKYDLVEGKNVEMLVGIPDVRYKAAIIKLHDNNRLELIEYLSHPGKKREPLLSNDVGCSHFAISVKNLDELYNQSVDYPVDFVSPPFLDGYVKVAYARIMNECLVEMVEVLDERARFSGGP